MVCPVKYLLLVTGTCLPGNGDWDFSDLYHRPSQELLVLQLESSPEPREIGSWVPSGGGKDAGHSAVQNIHSQSHRAKNAYCLFHAEYVPGASYMLHAMWDDIQNI